MARSKPSPSGTERVRRIQERRRSGAHGLHADRRLRRTRTRAGALRLAMREV